jgi:hypothetical protein
MCPDFSLWLSDRATRSPVATACTACVPVMVVLALCPVGHAIGGEMSIQSWTRKDSDKMPSKKSATKEPVLQAQTYGKESQTPMIGDSKQSEQNWDGRRKDLGGNFGWECWSAQPTGRPETRRLAQYAGPDWPQAANAIGAGGSTASINRAMVLDSESRIH